MTERKSTQSKKSGKSTGSAKDAVLRKRKSEEIVAFLLFAFGLFLLFALYLKMAGAIGGGIAFFLKACFGMVAYVFPILLAAYGILLLLRKQKYYSIKAILLLVLIFGLIQIFISGFYLGTPDDPLKGDAFQAVWKQSGEGESAGIFGMYVGGLIVKLIGKPGLFIFSSLGFLILSIIYAGNPISYYALLIKDRLKERKERKEELRAEEAFDEVAFEPKATRRSEPFLSEEEPIDPPENLKKRQKNIVETVVIENSILGDGEIVTEPGNNAITVYDEDDVPIGLEPPRYVRPGYGLDDVDLPDAFATSEEQDDTRVFTEADLQEDLSDLDVNSKSYTARIQKIGSAKAAGEPDENEEQVSLFAGTDGGEAKPRKSTANKAFHGSFEDQDAMRNYKLPPANLLKKTSENRPVGNAAELKARAAKLEQTLRDFRVDARVLNVTVGPTVTRYEVAPDVGVKIQSIKSLEPDLALKLEVKSVRVVPMPGQAVVGIEAYNAVTQIVSLRDLIDSPEFRTVDSKISFAIGKNISGERIIANLEDMPHLLIAGTTGSGKSVCINSILLSILYKARPDEVRLILIDPKVVELKMYNDIPHLLVPVVTSPERAATALNYAVTLMTDRYEKFGSVNVNKFANYNEKMISEGRSEDVLPQIVIVIDELSDLMMVAAQKVQDSISRLAAMARAAGIHLIVATQQPLASILTSVIKANIPSRIAFSVSSNSASRVILDEPGAERLHGKGDMLFSPVGVREPVRIQGAYVSDSEVYKVTEFIKNQMDPDYSPDVVQVVENGFSNQLVDDEDALFRDAVEMVVQAKQASVSMIQRRFRIGYNRSARLVDMMEERGIVAPSDGQNKPRKVLITDAQMNAYLQGAGKDSAGESYTSQPTGEDSQENSSDPAFSDAPPWSAE
ncbi:MAG: DNA translocase FtsK [Clostridiales Family XIII bacterium]|jgi:S-DNA-T family DNA segregation ATPase FtsK/SpoIIIE|nr:DNA translocase FtsK [Clostridiales Family XIII bacterium]